MSLDVREQDPAAARFNAVTQAVLFTLLGTVVGIVSAGLLTGTTHPLGWAIIVGVGVGAGGVPLARWMLDRRSEHIDLFGIDRTLRPHLTRAAALVDQIEQAAQAAPDGPVSEQLFENHATAVAHLRLIESDARQSGPASRQGLLQLCRQLDELAAASERLSSSALAALPTVLGSLTERTLLIDEALTADDASEVSGGPGLADRGATTDR